MSSSEPRLRLRLRITGRVQGVWYRGWTCEQARSLGLDGWVRNRSDGTVEALLAGNARDVAIMTDRCRTGPAAARVAAITEAPAQDPGVVGFRQLKSV